jgi:hypothetical protein
MAPVNLFAPQNRGIADSPLPRRRVSRKFGQVIRNNCSVTIGSRLGSVEREFASVVGPLCTPLDLLADWRELPELPGAEVGDLVVVQTEGHWPSASLQAFLSRLPAWRSYARHRRHAHLLTWAAGPRATSRCRR